MKREVLISLLVLLLVSGFAVAKEKEQLYKEGELLVRFKDTGPKSPLRAKIMGPRTNRSVKGMVAGFVVAGAEVQAEYEHVLSGLTLVKLPYGKTVKQASAEFNLSGNVLYAQPNFIYKLDAIPNDPIFSYQWSLDNIGQNPPRGTVDADIDAPEAWDIIEARGSSAVIVAVVDTGIDYIHEDINENMWLNSAEDQDTKGEFDANDLDGTDDDGNGYIDDIVGVDIAGDAMLAIDDGDGDPMDVHGHGTHVAGIIGAEGDNGFGIAGVCWDVSLMAVKVFADDQTGTTAQALTNDIVLGIKYAIDPHGKGTFTDGAHIINASLGNNVFDQTLYNVILEARHQKILFVASAGNFGIDNDSLEHYPSGYDLDNIISVMATDHHDEEAIYSNYGATEVDLAAPGGTGYGDFSDIYSLEPGGGFVHMGGTSMAAPHVAGACAAVWSVNSGLPYHEVKDIILNSVDRLGSLNGRCVSGGRLNLDRAVRMARKGKVVRVTPSKTFNTIQAAIDDTGTLNGHTLIADANRWYFENVDFGGKSIILRSGDTSNTSDPNVHPTTTFISGLFGHGDTVLMEVVDFNTVLKGFTICDSSDGSGVAILGSSPNIEDCIITDNIDGGGIYCLGSEPNIVDCTIEYNTGKGGVFCEDSNATIHDCNIQYNSSVDYGGGITCWDNSDVIIVDVNIVHNSTAKSGGGIYSHNSSPTINNCEISHNTSNGSSVYNDGGGGIHLDGSSGAIAEVNECEITENTAINGGGIYCTNNADASIADCDIRNNTSTWWGGGIYCNYSAADINNCLITMNISNAGYGAGIYVEDCAPTVNNCTIVENSTASGYPGAGLACYYSGDPQITNCIFSENAPAAIAVYEDSFTQFNASLPLITHSLFYNNSVGDYIEYDDTTNPATETIYTGASEIVDPNVPGASDNIDGDPLFVTGNLGDYYLSQVDANQIHDSNAVDAGSGTAVAFGLTYPYSTRTDKVGDSGKVDMGYHYYDLSAPLDCNLTIDIVPDNVAASPAEGTTVDKQYAQIELHARPLDIDEYQFKSWTGTDDDSKPIERYPYHDGRPEPNQFNVVTLDHDKTVTVTFELADVVLTTSVDPAGGDKKTFLPWSIRPMLHRRGDVVNLYAVPENSSHVIIWSGTDDDFSTLPNNTVTMDTDKHVEVLFYEPNHLYVGPYADYAKIQDAIDAAGHRDIIELAATGPAEPYLVNTGILVYKAVTIQSAFPDDPCCVADTIIQRDAGPFNLCFTFIGVGRDTVLNGITIQGFTGTARDGRDGDSGATPPRPNGENGYSLSGGAISCWGASPTIKNCIIADCNITAGNGGDGAGGDPAALPPHPEGYDGGWPGYAYGGGIAILRSFDGVKYIPSNPAIINCTIRDCAVNGGVGGDGGAAAANSDREGGRGGGWTYGIGNGSWWQKPWAYGYPIPYWTNTITNGHYDYYTKYSGRGGAMYIGTQCSPIVKGCTFINNQSQGGLNGIGGDADPPPLVSPPFIRRRIDNAGGAVFCAAGSQTVFEDCVFIDNDANDSPDPCASSPYVSYGGAVAFQDGADLTFDNCTFNGNQAAVGGGMYGDFSDPVVVDCDYINNTAMTGGGALFVGGSPQIAKSLFQNNRTTREYSRGGAIASHGANSEIVDCKIINNSAVGAGGGIYISNKDVGGNELEGGDKVLVKNCLVTENTAGIDGGGISVNWHSEPNIVNCTISGNAVNGYNSNTGYGGGLSVSYNSYANILNSIIWGNVARKGGQIAIGTGSESGPWFSTAKVSYSDIQDGATGVFVDTGCTLVWEEDANNLSGTGLSDPCFVSGSGYYLSEPDTNEPNQIVTGLSPCVDAGLGDASLLPLGKYYYTTRTDDEPDINEIDMGYHYPRSADFAWCDLNYDGVVGKDDLLVLAEHWLEQCYYPDWCQGADLNHDGVVNFVDYTLLTDSYGSKDTIAPAPNPMKWAVAPRSTGSAGITMTATKAVDNSGGDVDYEFECIFGGGHHRSWAASSTYTDTGLTLNAEYGYKVRAKDAQGNETEWSLPGYAVVGLAIQTDFMPPTPNPMDWSRDPNGALVGAPYSMSLTSIGMIAETAIDANSPPVEYWFERVSGGGSNNSDWIPIPSWSDTGLTTGQQYGYTVKARDAEHNPTQPSDVGYAIPSTIPPPADTTPPQPQPVITYTGSWVEILPTDLFSGQYMIDYTLIPGSGHDHEEWYHKVVVDVSGITDVNPIEIKFVCLTDEALSSPWVALNGTGVYGNLNDHTDGTITINGSLQIYDKNINKPDVGNGDCRQWKVIVRDTSVDLNENHSAPVWLGPGDYCIYY